MRRIFAWIKSEDLINQEEYMQIPRWAMWPGALGHIFFWWYLPAAFNLIEIGWARFLNVVAFLLFPVFINRLGSKFRVVNRWLWFTFCTWHFFCHPWLSYHVNSFHPYWMASLAFFGATAGFALRSFDLMLSLLIGIAFSMALSGLSHVQTMGYVFTTESSIVSMVGIMYVRHIQQKLVSAKMEMTLALEQMQKIEKSKDDFISSAAHELRTPVAVALAVAEAIPEGVKQREYLVSALLHARSQVNSLLDFRALAENALVLDKSLVPLTPFFSQISNTYATLCRQKDIEFQAVIRHDDLVANVDRERLYSAVTNLLNNAYKFTQEHGTIKLVVAADFAGNMTILVKDNGIGISADDLSRIFDRYFQVEGPMKRDGIGIGLTIVKSIVEAHDGSIKIISTLGIGTRVLVTIPGQLKVRPGARQVLLSSSSSTEKYVDVNMVDVSKKTILMVEDNRNIRIHMRVWMENEGYNVISFSKSSDALDFIGKHLPELFICVTDISLPDLDGIELARMIRDMPLYADVPFLFSSGYSTGSITKRLEKFNNYGIIEKPFNRLEFLERFNLAVTISSLDTP